jgi:hypothetical protein
MWRIAIRSSIITLLGFVAYGLLVQTLRLNGPIVGSLEYVVFMAGIYSAHYDYKATHKQQMTYGKGIKLGLMTVFLTALWASAIVYGMIRYYGKKLILLLLKDMEIFLQQAPSQHPSSQASPSWLALLDNPLVLSIAIFVSILLTGTVLTFILSWASKAKNNR